MYKKKEDEYRKQMELQRSGLQKIEETVKQQLTEQLGS
jgi:hypothetical protein